MIANHNAGKIEIANTAVLRARLRAARADVEMDRAQREVRDAQADLSAAIRAHAEIEAERAQAAKLAAMSPAERKAFLAAERKSAAPPTGEDRVDF